MIKTSHKIRKELTIDNLVVTIKLEYYANFITIRGLYNQESNKWKKGTSQIDKMSEQEKEVNKLWIIKSIQNSDSRKK